MENRDLHVKVTNNAVENLDGGEVLLEGRIEVGAIGLGTGWVDGQKGTVSFRVGPACG